MKLNTIQKLYHCMKTQLPELIMDGSLMDEARRPLQRMLEMSAGIGTSS
jgi:quinolinate synthase